jgi:antitoxin FitA
MASITIRKLDDGVKAKLRIRAAQNGHSMEEEVREILVSAVQEKSEPQENLYDAIRRRMAEAGLKGFDLPEYPRGPMREPPTFD